MTRLVRKTTKKATPDQPVHTLNKPPGRCDIVERLVTAGCVQRGVCVSGDDVRLVWGVGSNRRLKAFGDPSSGLEVGERRAGDVAGFTVDAIAVRAERAEIVPAVDEHLL